MYQHRFHKTLPVNNSNQGHPLLWSCLNDTEIAYECQELKRSKKSSVELFVKKYGMVLEYTNHCK